MPWNTPTLKDTRRLTRDYVLSQLGAKAMIPNSVLRIMSDAMAGLTHLTFLYLDWLAKQLMPDTAEQEWLDRHGVIWLTNADGSKGRKAATFSNGMVQFEGLAGTIIPVGMILRGPNNIDYQLVTDGQIGSNGFGNADAVALVAGAEGNLLKGTTLGIPSPSAVGEATASCFEDMSGGVNQETDEQLRERVLLRIQNPPQGGAAHDYVQWALAVPGVTRAWCYPLEMGIGTVTVRFLMDDIHPDNYGLPTAEEVAMVEAYIDQKRPVAVKDTFVVAPIIFLYTIEIVGLTQDDSSTRARIETAIKNMEFAKAKPGQTMFRSWVDEAISQAVGEESHELIFETVEMPAPGYMPALGSVIYRD